VAKVVINHWLIEGKEC